MDFVQIITEKFPVRKNAAQKESFRKYAIEQAKQLGYDAKVEKNGRQNNVVIGDPDHAAMVFTAHYDTPATILIPNMMFPKNLPLFILYQLAVVILMVAVSLILPAGLIFLGNSANTYMLTVICLYIFILFMMVAGKANKNNVNDNTSGVATLFSTMEKIPEENRRSCAFILFDNEEKGKLGSKAYAKDHQQLQYMKLVVNVDCVGNGEKIVFAPSKMAQKCSGFCALIGEMRRENEDRIIVTSPSLMNSDQASFKCGVLICACKKSRFAGYYTPYLHTKKDTYADKQNISLVSDCFSNLAKSFIKD